MMKKKELKKVQKNKVGKIVVGDLRLELGEYMAAVCLAQYGFDVEFLKPSNTRRVNNPDLFMLGSTWELKSPETSKESTIKERFRKASRQSDKIIFDLRLIKGKMGADKVMKQLIEMFQANGRVRRMMIIDKNEKIFDIIK